MVRKFRASGPQVAQIVKSKRNGYVTVVSPYNPHYVENLKFNIPYPHRLYNPDDKSWDISETYLPDLIALLKMYYTEVTQNIVTKEPVTGNPFAGVFKFVAKDDLTKVYRALAFAVHPDRGGSEATMKMLNDAYEEMLKQGGV